MDGQDRQDFIALSLELIEVLILYILHIHVRIHMDGQDFIALSVELIGSCLKRACESSILQDPPTL